MNKDIHVYKTRTGGHGARISYNNGEKECQHKIECSNLQNLMLQVTRHLLLLETNTQ